MKLKINSERGEIEETYYINSVNVKLLNNPNKEGQLFSSGGVAYFSESNSSINVLNEWLENIIKYPKAPDDQLLDHTFNYSSTVRKNLKFEWLDKSYCRVYWWIFSQPIIDHPGHVTHRANDNFFKITVKERFKIENTINKQSFISPNWRAFDLIYWMSQRSIRKSSKKGTLQNAFAFYETALGFNYKSLDSMIEDIVDQDETDTDVNQNKPKLYTYDYVPKRMLGQEIDQFTIDRISFPKEKNFLMGLRHGNWSGYSVGFDPVFITRSKMGTSTDLSADAYRYSMSSLWKRMAHLNGGNSINPQKRMDNISKNWANYPKRVRYSMIPNQIFDPKLQNNPQRNYEQLVELQAYQWMRIESLKQCQMTIVVPGNLDLYAGSGINVNIPTTYKEGDTPKRDAKYSGRWLIAAVAHKNVGLSFETELALMKDSDIPNLTQNSGTYIA